MRPTPALIAPLLLLAGCNLFRSADIPTTCEDLPGGCGGIDTHPPDDTDDTAPWVPDNEFGMGMALATIAGDTVKVRAWGPDGVLLTEGGMPLDDIGEAGPVAYDPAGPDFYVWDHSGHRLWIWEGGNDPFSASLSEGSDATNVRDLVVMDGTPYLVTANAIWSYNSAEQSIDELGSNDSLYSVSSVFVAYEDNLFLLDGSADEQPDLYRFTVSSAESRLSYEDFDDGLGRASQGFKGPESKPYVCSPVGGMYSVESLQGGDQVPAAYPDQDQLAELFGGAEHLVDITECAWDDTAELYLLHSTIHGVISMDSWGRLEQRYDGAGEELVSACFFDPVEDDSDTD